MAGELGRAQFVDNEVKKAIRWTLPDILSRLEDLEEIVINRWIGQALLNEAMLARLEKLEFAASLDDKKAKSKEFLAEAKAHVKVIDTKAIIPKFSNGKKNKK